MRAYFGNIGFLLAIVMLVTLSSQLVQCQQKEHYSPYGNLNAASRGSRNGYSRFNRTSPPPTTTACEYKELMTKLNDRVSVLASLDEDQRNRLESIEKKIVQFESNNLGRLDSLNVQQMDLGKKLDVLEHMQRMNNRQVEEFKSQFLLWQQKQLELATINGNELSRTVRQVNGTENVSDIDVSTKLDALATLLSSTRESINFLQNQLAANISLLLMSTSHLARRTNTIARRQQLQSGPISVPLPMPSNFHPLNAICSYSNPADSLGLQKLQLSANTPPFYVACDDKIDGGGWTVIQNRYSGEINFQRDWIEYKTGFGNVAGEYFIGLDKLHELTTSSLHELIILMMDFNNQQRTARYSAFAISSERELYTLNLLGTYSGDAGDSLSYHAGSKFSTFDTDNDGWLEGNCALAHTGAWWYNACEKSNLNGQYLGGEHDAGMLYQGMYWEEFNGPKYSLKAVRMMIRPVSGDNEGRR